MKARTFPKGYNGSYSHTYHTLWDLKILFNSKHTIIIILITHFSHLWCVAITVSQALTVIPIKPFPTSFDIRYSLYKNDHSQLYSLWYKIGCHHTIKFIFICSILYYCVWYSFYYSTVFSSSNYSLFLTSEQSRFTNEEHTQPSENDLPRTTSTYLQLGRK